MPNDVSLGGLNGNCGDPNGNSKLEHLSLQDRLTQAGYPESIGRILTSLSDASGLDVHPFLVEWYNEKVGSKFKLEYPNGSLCFVVISGPDAFEKCVVPFVQTQLDENPDFVTNDPIDDTFKHAFKVFQARLESVGIEADAFHDFDLHPSRRPKVLVQTAAHVAGVVQYLRKTSLPEDIQIQRLSEKSNLTGVAIHPKYGGWYGIRGVLILKSPSSIYENAKLEIPEPVQIFDNEDIIARVIELFAYKWQTNEWRDVHPGTGCKYSRAFLTYLETDYSKRWEYVKSYVDTFK